MVEPSLDGSFSTNGPAGDYALLLARAWSGRLEAELPAAVQATQSLRALWSAYDHSDDWRIDQPALDLAFRAMWTADATLIWTANQVDRWTVQLARETKQPVPATVPGLRTPHNALEHLDDAVFEDDGYATAPSGKAGFALSNLPNGRLLVADWKPGGKLYGLIEINPIRDLARAP